MTKLHLLLTFVIAFAPLLWVETEAKTQRRRVMGEMDPAAPGGMATKDGATPAPTVSEMPSVFSSSQPSDVPSDVPSHVPSFMPTTTLMPSVPKGAMDKEDKEGKVKRRL
ncbi:hypothetical protein ACA910_002680 [Epithemia clementina (nom. ined.)]